MRNGINTPSRLPRDFDETLDSCDSFHPLGRVGATRDLVSTSRDATNNPGTPMRRPATWRTGPRPTYEKNHRRSVNIIFIRTNGRDLSDYLGTRRVVESHAGRCCCSRPGR
jgi:hypothetical protein